MFRIVPPGCTDAGDECRRQGVPVESRKRSSASGPGALPSVEGDLWQPVKLQDQDYEVQVCQAVVHHEATHDQSAIEASVPAAADGKLWQKMAARQPGDLSPHRFEALARRC